MDKVTTPRQNPRAIQKSFARQFSGAEIIDGTRF
jgi:hypothetical protein